jgi:hypothetical protein
MGGALWIKPLKVLQNEDYSMILGFATQDPSGNLSLATPVNFTGMTAKLQVYEAPTTSSTNILTLTTGGGGLTLGGPTTYLGVSFGTITIAITNAVTSGLPVGEWFYDCFVYGGSINTPYLQGPFSVGWSVTR